MPTRALAERRMDQPAGDEEGDEQHRQRVPIVVVPPQIVLEQAEDGVDGDAQQPVEAAGIGLERVGQLLQHDGGGQGQHQQGEAAIAQQEPARHEADQTRAQAGESQARQGLVPAAQRRQHAGRVGAGAEEGGVAQGDDPGIAQHQVERQREDDHHQHLRAERHVVGEREERADHGQPRQRLGRVRLVAAEDRRGRGRQPRRRRAGAHTRLPYRPRGIASSTAMVMV